MSMNTAKAFSFSMSAGNTLGRLASMLQPPLMLAIRLYWGWQFAQSGWGKLHRLPKMAEYFSSLHLPSPGLTAAVVSGLEFVGGLLLILGLGARFFGLMLAATMSVAYWTADRDALMSAFSNPEKFYNADPFTFWFAALLVLVFGPGRFSLDVFIGRVVANDLAPQSIQGTRRHSQERIGP